MKTNDFCYCSSFFTREFLIGKVGIDKANLFNEILHKKITNIVFIYNHLRADSLDYKEQMNELKIISSSSKKLHKALLNINYSTESLIREGLLIRKLPLQDNLSIDLSSQLEEIFLAIETINVDLKKGKSGVIAWEKEEIIEAIYFSWIESIKTKPTQWEKSNFVKLVQYYLIDFKITPKNTPSSHAFIIKCMKTAKLKILSKTKKYDDIVN